MAYPRPLYADVDMSMGTVPEGNGTQPQPMGINAMLVCTYNESHLCSGGRYFAHIEECRKAYLASGGAPAKMLQCPFRSSHHVYATAMRQHIEMCDGYYEWHMLNQKDPPSMVAECLALMNSMDKKEGTETGTDGEADDESVVVASTTEDLTGTEG